MCGRPVRVAVVKLNDLRGFAGSGGLFSIILTLLLLIPGSAFTQSKAPAPIHPPAPEWMKDLVIYEIATKAFTSPNGPGSGTFSSLKERLPYLQDLGITGIWLTGHS